MDLDIPGGPRYDGRFDRDTTEWWRVRIRQLCSNGNAKDAVALFHEFEVNYSIFEWCSMIRLERMRLSEGQNQEQD